MQSDDITDVLFSQPNPFFSGKLSIFAIQTVVEMNNRKQDIAYFVSFCVEQYKTAKGMSGKEAMEVLNQYGVLEYLEECYEPLHTQGKQWLLEEIDEFINLRKGG